MQLYYMKAAMTVMLEVEGGGGEEGVKAEVQMEV